MNKCWMICTGRLFIDMFYCHTAEQAITMAKKKWGDPRSYTDTSNGAYRAIEV
tara:strand:- start:416 stop:574 length:159 start_codon:yes stop_codon:yes gene_type:complete